LKKRKNLIYVILFLALTFFLWIGISLLPSPRQIGIQPGDAADLRDADLQTQVYNFYGASWESYPEKLYTPEDFESGGVSESSVPSGALDYTSDQYATHITRFFVPAGKTYAIFMRSSDYAMRLYINGEEIDCVGVPGTSREETTPRVLERVYAFTPEGDAVTLIAQTANFVHKDGAYPPEFTIGSVMNISRHTNKTLLFTLLITGCLLTAALYHLGIYILNRSRQTSLLFSLCCLLLIFLSGKLIPLFFTNYNWHIVFRFEYFVHFAVFAALTLFIDRLHPGLLLGRVTRIYYAVCALYTLTLIMDSTIFTRLLIGFELISAAMIAYILVRMALSLNRGGLALRLSFIGILPVCLFGVNDMLMRIRVMNFLGVFAEQLFTTPIGMMFFVFCYALALSAENAETERANELLGRMNTFKTEFLSNVSHELKTPLTIISNYAQLARMHAEDTRTQDGYVVDKMILVTSEAERMAIMVGQLLDISRIEEGRMSFSFAPADIAALIRDAMNTFYPVFNKNDNALALDLPDNLGLVRCDRERVRQVLLNLVSNAIRFTRGGIITVSAKRDGGFVSVSVTDTGEGIPKEVIAGIFNRYATAPPDSDKSSTGTGLGLHITKHIVEAHGGTIAAISKKGSGTTMTFTLPFAGGMNHNGAKNDIVN